MSPERGPGYSRARKMAPRCSGREVLEAERGTALALDRFYAEYEYATLGRFVEREAGGV